MLITDFSLIPSVSEIFKGLFLNFTITAILVLIAWFKKELNRMLRIFLIHGKFVFYRKPIIPVWVDDGFLLARLASNLEKELGEEFEVTPLESPDDLFNYPQNSRIIPAVLLIVTDVTKLSEDENKRIKIQQWLRKYVENGGGLIGGHDIIYRRTRNEILENVFGGEITEFQRIDKVRYIKNKEIKNQILFSGLPDEFELDDGELVWGSWSEDAKILFHSPPPHSYPLVTVREYGKGKAIWINSCDKREGFKNPITSNNYHLLRLISNAILWLSKSSSIGKTIPKVLGHRGYPDKYPENTVLSFVEAVRNGADGIELDVWLSKDGIAVVFHDEMVEDDEGVPRRIKEMTFVELKKIDLPLGQRIPTLEEVIDTLPEDCFVNVEIKDRDAVEEVIGIVKQRNMERFIVTSFSPDTLKRCRHLVNDIKTGLITSLENSLKLIGNEEEFSKLLFLANEIDLWCVAIPVECAMKVKKDEFEWLVDMIVNSGLNLLLWAYDDENFYRSGVLNEFSDKIYAVITDNPKRMKDFLLSRC